MTSRGFVVSLVALFAYMALCGVFFRWCMPARGTVRAAETVCGKEVKNMRTALLMAIAVAGCAGSGVDQQGLVPGGRVPVPVQEADAGDALMMAVGDTLVDLGIARAADAEPTADTQPRVFPSCEALGYHEQLSSCEDRRTRDQGYSCGTCGATPPPQPCVSAQPHPGDLPWLCVAKCSDCAAVVKCTGANKCTVVGFDDGGAL